MRPDLDETELPEVHFPFPEYIAEVARLPGRTLLGEVVRGLSQLRTDVKQELASAPPVYWPAPAAVLRTRGEVSTLLGPSWAESLAARRNYCQMAEGKLAKGVMANPGGAAMCDRGGKCIFKFAKCTKCGRSEMGGKEDVERTPSKEKASGYKSVPQWMNDRAHCLKCDAVLKTQATIHGSSAVPENMEKDLDARFRMDV
ncbi:hypothetical protein AK812_SmicGene26585 [Symbiodinium microadriaticum]|uniref:Uncharacterized protein n=1 Tax=Symbiodinium microadriaticum TaxID=2951 RepID=A0A1Q9D962_SYMMI|nr:hypothetical protein AK812_SmicGene26585 [Symbiodinium microadriaticum]